MAIWRGVGGSGDAVSDAANEASIAVTKANEAALSAEAAASSAASAATEAANALSQATNSQNSANDSANSATDAATSASEAADSAADAALRFDEFDDRYLGTKATDPTVDNDGNPLLTGALYFNSVTQIMMTYTGSVWQTITTGTGGLQIANNLSDLQNVATARTNLGLGTAATTASTDYATAAQGTLADSAVQPTDNISTLTNDSGYVTPSSTATFTNKAGNISQWTNDAGYLTSFTETNDLTAAVTWANVPDANITQSSVTQHQAALSITESQISDLGTYVVETSATGSAEIPSGTTAQRDGTPAAGYLRFNTTDSSFEGYDGSAWGAIGGGGGASGGGSDAIFYENGQTITTSYTITSNTNAMSTGPLTVNSGVSVTVPSGSRWVVL